MKTIVLGYDGSESAKRALEQAAELCSNGTNLEVVVAERVTYAMKGAISAIDPIEAEGAEQALEEVRSWLSEHGIKAKLIEAVGDPVRAIVQEADRSSADLIVVGTNSKGSISRALLGSVSAGVVNHAHCNVLVVR